MLIGMLHVRKNPERVSRAYLYAAAAKLEGHDFVYFTARNVDFKTKTIDGQYYENGAWHRKTFPFPDVWINIVRPRTEKQRKVYNRLKRMIPYTGYNVGSKVEVYEKIEKGTRYRDHLIPYQTVSNINDVFYFLERYPRSVLKPVIGHHGDDVYYLEKTLNGYLIKDEHSRVDQYSYTVFRTVIEKIIGKRNMLIQRYIECKTKDGLPYDIRLHLQKDENGEWNLAYIQPKVGVKEKIITNVIKGGVVPPSTEFFKKEFGPYSQLVINRLTEFALGFTPHFEAQYEYFFDELGIDVGLDKDLNIWIYEVNSRPGQSFLEGQTARRAILYAAYIVKKRKGELNETDTTS